MTRKCVEGVGWKRLNALLSNVDLPESAASALAARTVRANRQHRPWTTRIARTAQVSDMNMALKFIRSWRPSDALRLAHSLQQVSSDSLGARIRSFGRRINRRPHVARRF